MSVSLAGQRFGYLTVIAPLPDRDHDRIIWRCLCDCGKETTASTSKLRSGQKKSCGCMMHAGGAKNAIDITGKRFGRLVALCPTEKRQGHSIIWHCRCDCGNEIDASANNLKQGAVRSCGCLATEHGRDAIHVAKAARAKYYIDGTDVKCLAQPPRGNNTSGVTGVHWDSSVRTWKATIVFKHQCYYLGSSRDKDVAIALRKEAENRLHGDFLKWYKSHTEKPPDR